MASVVAICDYLFEPVVLCDQFLFKEGELFKSSVRKESLLTAADLFGASLKDAGRKLFAYIKMQETSASELLNNIR